MTGCVIIEIVTPVRMMAHIGFSRDGTWAYISFNMAVYPRDDGTHSVGRLDGARTYVDVETGFPTQQVAIDRAVWLSERMHVSE